MEHTAKDWAFVILNKLSAQGVGRRNLYKFVLYATTRTWFRAVLLKQVPEALQDEVLKEMKQAIQ